MADKQAQTTAKDDQAAAAVENKEHVPAPTGRNVLVADDATSSQNMSNMLLVDLIRLHYLLLPKDKGVPSEEKDVEELAERLTLLMLKGKKYELAGLKDVPRPFLKGEGQFLEKGDDGKWKEVSEESAQAFVSKKILSEFKTLAESKPELQDAELKENISTFLQNPTKSTTDAAATSAEAAKDAIAPHSAPRPFDVLYLPIDFPVEEGMTLYEHQSGNKHTLFLASQYVSSDTKDCPKRVAAAFKLVTAKVEVNNGNEVVQNYPRHIIQHLVDNQNAWQAMEQLDVAEMAVLFVFEVYLEKQVHGTADGSGTSSSAAADMSEESHVPIEAPTSYDVLFGRGGMTNSHPGNRRFRDIISLHRPDYIRATKMDKPNVARKIVKAIRQGVPPGRFLKKADSGKWFDVGDRCAAEKTSQGLRERSNAEKRQRSALREALKIRREDLAENEGAESPTKKKKLALPDSATFGQLGMLPGYSPQTINYAGTIPLSLSMKEKTKDTKTKKPKAKGDGKDEAGDNDDSQNESLPPNAVDKDGNILVTDYDILCGRGGLTNHHPGNKRFRDIVALHRPDYVRAPKIQKPSVARIIVRAIRHGDPPGRFIKKDEKTGKWLDIGDKRAAEKTSQALREKTNEEKDRPKTAAGFVSPTAFLTSAAATPLAAATEAKEENGGKEEAGTTEEKPDESGKKTGDKEDAAAKIKADDETKGSKVDIDEKKAEDGTGPAVEV